MTTDLLKTHGYRISFDGFNEKTERCEFTIHLAGQTFPYFTGSGFIKTKRGGYRINLSERTARKINCKHSALDRYYIAKPDPIEALCCVFFDAEATGTCFELWCEEYGYDADSIKDRELYQKCVENGLKLRRALGSDFYAMAELVKEKEDA